MEWVAKQTSLRDPYTRYGKPLFDFTLSLFILILLSLVLLIVTLLIKLDSAGPAIFRQTRIGKDGKAFQIYKFRTMYVHVPNQGRSPEHQDDPRITKIGKILRKTSIDELPQLFNILRGEMSLVGPRPEQQQIVDQYYTAFERQRFLVKPGVTGLWQISIARRNPIHENLQYDFDYIRNVSLMTDLKILIRTAFVMIKSNTY